MTSSVPPSSRTPKPVQGGGHQVQLAYGLMRYPEARSVLLARGISPAYFSDSACRKVVAWVTAGKPEPAPDDVVAALQQLEDQFPFCPVNNAAEAISDIERLTGNFAEEHASVLWQAEARGENTTNSIRAPIEKGSARIEWDPVPIEDLGPAVPPDWLWTGFLAKQHITLFVGLWKCGKTTLVTHLLRDLKTGGGLIGTGAGGRKVLLVTEEGPTLWTRRRDDLGLSETVDVLIRPFMTKPDHAAWREFLEHLRALVIARGYDLVVFDTLSNLWPVMNENDAGEVGAALMPLRALSDAGPALMLIHHPRKGGGDEAQATRGSGALPGFVDVIMELGRYAKDDPYDRRRVLKTHSRFEESMPESVIELTDAGYLVVGDKIQVKQGDRAAVIAGILPEEGSGLTPEEVLDRWTTEPRPGLRSVETDLAAGASGGRWVKTGGGKRGDPFRFRRANGFDSRKPASLGARIESEPSAPAQTPAIKPMPEATDEGEWRAVV